MKIWLPTIATGTGAEVYARRLAEGLAARGHKVRLDVVPHRFQYAPWLARLRPPGGTHVTLANSWSAAAFAGAAPLVTVVHHVVHDPAFARHRSLAQAIFHRGFVRPMERRALRASAAVIAVSETTAAAVRAGLADVPLNIVLNGVDTDFFCPGATRAPRPAAAPLELLFVGKPSRRKGFDLVAEIVARLGDACRLTSVGPAPERGLSAPPGRHLGRLPAEALRRAYREADLLLLPSWLEGFGYTAAEAMACGTPVACAEGGAVAEIVAPPDCGLACPAGDVAGFVETIAALGRDRPRLGAMRRAARARAVERLDAARWLAETEAVLVRAAGERPA